MNENIRIPKRAREITPFWVMDILEAAHRLAACAQSLGLSGSGAAKA